MTGWGGGWCCDINPYLCHPDERRDLDFQRTLNLEFGIRMVDCLMYDLGYRQPRKETMSYSSLLRTLPYAGALPFVLGAAAQFSSTLPTLIYMVMFIDVQHLVLSYGLLIVSFMAGVHWGQSVSGVQSRFNLLVSSNAVALIAWVCYLTLPPFYVCLVFAALFALLYVIDTRLSLDPSYLQTRRNVTCIVGISLVAVAFS
jgi:Protein of unknown function (DUF3429)